VRCDATGRSLCQDGSRASLPPIGGSDLPRGCAASVFLRDITHACTHIIQVLYRIDECPPSWPTAASATSTATWSSCPSGARYRLRSSCPPHLGRPARAGTSSISVTRSGRRFRSSSAIPDNREKRHHARLPAQRCSGSMSPLWLFDKRLREARQANRQALDATAQDMTDHTERLNGRWCGDLPLRCRYWRDAVLELLQSRDMLTRLSYRPRCRGKALRLAPGRSGPDTRAGRTDPQTAPWCFAVELASGKPLRRVA